MSAQPESVATGADNPPITSKSQLVEYLAAGCKPRSNWRIGTEHEKFAFNTRDLRPLPYDGEAGIGALLEGLSDRFGWQKICEGSNPVALTKDGCSITLEPGGQFELSGAPLENIHQTCDEVHTHLAQVKEVAEPLGVHMLGVGFQPKWGRSDISWMPKGRYKIMGSYMPKKGNLGLDMMLRTCTVQVNLDFESEADMVKKFRTSLALQPIATALFANSPFTDGKPNGFLSYRSHIWTDTDPDRCGVPSFVFDEDMSFERYVDYVLDVPMYFIYRNGTYVDVSGQSFRDFMAGNLPGRKGELPTMGDWADHLTTLFPEVRLKKFIEMRGADGGPWRSLCGLPALWVGLLYDQETLDAAWDMVKNWTMEDHDYLRAEVPRQALATPFQNSSVREVAQQMVALAEQGLRHRNRLDSSLLDETHFVAPLKKVAESGKTPADEQLEQFHGEWGGRIDPLFEQYAY
ncbi:glutamate--cysteine ligase [Pelagibius sp. Alg239-R121]|uniref:glutamate--cysteine ligase n=1 Tax=Pelagibius sp. Alg239-R121 TaxID=2993448 RepID=UPI0024A6E527|nr:glutamate--cysteine ligase [Pelagibius sp. Alg239-R121]